MENVLRFLQGIGTGRAYKCNPGYWWATAFVVRSNVRRAGLCLRALLARAIVVGEEGVAHAAAVVRVVVGAVDTQIAHGLSTGVAYIK